LERRNLLLAEIASSDGLTGLKNHRSFRESLEAQFSLARWRGAPLSVVMLDVDQFKPFNDSFGHQAGDALLDCMFRTANGRLTAAEALGHREFVLTRLYESA